MLERSQNVRCWQVSELNSYLKELLANNPFLANLWVKGEISNLRQPSSGHLYFTLKDRSGSVRSVMFRSRAVKLPMPLRDGMEVMLRASLTIYERDGVYQLMVEEVQPLGAGDLHAAFEQLKQQLEMEGLFSSKWKKSLPRLPKKIGIVTSLSGAVLQDMLTTILVRFPYVQILVAPALVQGVGAPDSIVNALKLLNRFKEVDVIIAGRGGGSLEELWAFNTEKVARAIFDSSIPIVSAVGHETDYTIADMVADRRAPTPTAAGVLVVPDYQDQRANLESILENTKQKILNLIEPKQQRLTSVIEYSLLAKPENLFLQQHQHLKETNKNINYLKEKFLTEHQTQLEIQAKKLDSLSPLRVLGRGFALCHNQAGKIIVSTNQVSQGEMIEVMLQDGYLECQVQEVK